MEGKFGRGECVVGLFSRGLRAGFALALLGSSGIWGGCGYRIPPIHISFGRLCWYNFNGVRSSLCIPHFSKMSMFWLPWGADVKAADVGTWHLAPSGRSAGICTLFAAAVVSEAFWVWKMTLLSCHCQPLDTKQEKTHDLVEEYNRAMLVSATQTEEHSGMLRHWVRKQNKRCLRFYNYPPTPFFLFLFFIFFFTNSSPLHSSLITSLTTLASH